MGSLAFVGGGEIDANFDRHCCDLVRTEPGNFRIHPVAAFATLSASRVAPNLGSVRAQAKHGPSPTLKQDEGLIDRAHQRGTEYAAERAQYLQNSSVRPT